MVRSCTIISFFLLSISLASAKREIDDLLQHPVRHTQAQMRAQTHISSLLQGDEDGQGTPNSWISTFASLAAGGQVIGGSSNGAEQVSNNTWSSFSPTALSESLQPTSPRPAFTPSPAPNEKSAAPFQPMLTGTFVVLVAFAIWLLILILCYGGWGAPHPQQEWDWSVVAVCCSTAVISVGGLVTWYIFCRWRHQPPTTWSFALHTSTLVSINLLNWLILYQLRLHIFREQGFSEEHIALANGPRCHWTKDTVDLLTSKYGEEKVRVCDACVRRSGHLWNNILSSSLFIPHVITNQYDRLLAVTAYYALGACLKTALVGREGMLANMVFQGSRIMDGQLGRDNLVVVKFSEGMGFIWFLAIFDLMQVEPTRMPHLLSFCVQPVIWGDTMAELVGSFFGRLKFKVYGFGTYNVKTVEGVVACWLASFCACWLYLALRVEALSTVLSIGRTGWFLAEVASVATFAEAVSPRGMDNAFMMISVAIVACLHYPSELDC